MMTSLVRLIIIKCLDIEKTQIVSKINYNRFALVVEKAAIVMNPALIQQSLIT